MLQPLLQNVSQNSVECSYHYHVLYLVLVSSRAPSEVSKFDFSDNFVSNNSRAGTEDPG